MNYVAGLGLEPVPGASEGCVFSALRGCLPADDSKDFLAGITLPFILQTHDSSKRKMLGSGH